MSSLSFWLSTMDPLLTLIDTLWRFYVLKSSPYMDVKRVCYFRDKVCFILHKLVDGVDGSPLAIESPLSFFTLLASKSLIALHKKWRECVLLKLYFNLLSYRALWVRLGRSSCPVCICGEPGLSLFLRIQKVFSTPIRLRSVVSPYVHPNYHF